MAASRMNPSGCTRNRRPERGAAEGCVRDLAQSSILLGISKPSNERVFRADEKAAGERNKNKQIVPPPGDRSGRGDSRDRESIGVTYLLEWSANS
jgi:hypothetical protein